jgi:hypothetical protein
MIVTANISGGVVSLHQIRRPTSWPTIAVAVLLATAIPACGGNEEAVIDPGDDGSYEVKIDPTEFTSDIDNEWLPLATGSSWDYELTDAEGELEEIVTVEVLDERRTVMGVETVVVKDVVSTTSGEVLEDTRDWFAQDSEGNVWYFGEETVSYEDGEANTAGSWEAGIDGALPGIVMLGDPLDRDGGYRQEYLEGEAEDMGEVIGLEEPVSVPAGDFDDVLVTKEWTPLESDTVEEKTYARGVGMILEEQVQGPDEGERGELLQYVLG